MCVCFRGSKVRSIVECAEIVNAPGTDADAQAGCNAVWVASFYGEDLCGVSTHCEASAV